MAVSLSPFRAVAFFEVPSAGKFLVLTMMHRNMGHTTGHMIRSIGLDKPDLFADYFPGSSPPNYTPGTYGVYDSISTWNAADSVNEYVASFMLDVAALKPMLVLPEEPHDPLDLHIYIGHVISPDPNVESWSDGILRWDIYDGDWLEAYQHMSDALYGGNESSQIDQLRIDWPHSKFIERAAHAGRAETTYDVGIAGSYRLLSPEERMAKTFQDSGDWYENTAPVERILRWHMHTDGALPVFEMATVKTRWVW